MLVGPRPLSLPRHLHPFFPEIQHVSFDHTRGPFSLFQGNLSPYVHKISVALRVQCGGKRKVPNEKPQAPPEDSSCGRCCDVPHDRRRAPCWLAPPLSYRSIVQVHLANEAVKVFTRRGHDWTHRFKKVADDAWHIKASSAIIDGEVVVPAADGSTDFSVLQNELTEHLDQVRARRLRPALSPRQGPPEGAAIRAR